MTVLSALRESSAPGVAVEIASHRVSAASLEFRGDSAVVAAHATEPLPDGALVPSLTAVNLHDRPAVVSALRRVFERIGGRPRRVGLVVPDLVAKVSLVTFEQVPTRAQELEQLVRFHIRKAAPFPIEEAQVSYVPGLRMADGQEFIASLARRDVILEYEGVCAELGAQAGLVDLSTFNVVNAVLAGGNVPSADWLLVNVAPDYASIAIMRGDQLIFFRSRAADGDGNIINDLVHQTAMYYEDRLSGAGFSRVLVAGAASGGSGPGADAEQVRRSLEARLNAPVDTVDPRGAAALTDRIVAAPALLDALTPLVGLLLRDRAAVKAG